ncbi:hypothetical protein [Chryseobacterium balustinum]|uniref:Uncharacterized protein n=1 Tax=Chryseobacterium balustinum TaxID=246 RepID=A0AAX2IRB1_9FLAO|nr:hypothetical protein [Chryseobacterium balustinum]AZB32117.1 hypothetical protein EB354_22825 [Chryseobacterium balustinum]SKB94015.1 hypothetical protein SAMN05421800_11564 [Chryseobacterium balustinum]SQA92272.1 Uncharacterised protein [Chryseobacterium balustinum]
MKANLFKNFKTLKQKEEELKPVEDEKEDIVSVVAEEKKEEIENKPEIVEAKEIVKEEVKKTLIAEKEVVAETKKPVEKKRPVKKEILEAKAALAASQASKTSYAKQITVNQTKRSFTIFLKADSLEFLKDLVFYKATEERLIFYNQSEAFVEAMDLIIPSHKNIIPRPELIREQEKNKKGGRKRNSDEVYETTTTVYIPGEYFDFIKDVTYNKVVSGDLYYKDWDLLEESIQKLKKKYGDKIQSRPDYIREDEKLRGRKSKSDSK